MNIAAALHAIAERHGLVALYAFGSRAAEVAGLARGEESMPGPRGSDLDLGAQPRAGRRLTAREKVELALDLEALLAGNDRVDLVVASEAPAFLALEIVRGEVIACTDADEQARYELEVLRRAGDLAGFEQERIRAIFEEDAS